MSWRFSPPHQCSPRRATAQQLCVLGYTSALPVFRALLWRLEDKESGWHLAYAGSGKTFRKTVYAEVVATNAGMTRRSL